MNRRQSSIDGFIPRRVGGQLGERPSPDQPPRRPAANGLRPSGEGLGRARSQGAPALEPSRFGLTRADVAESLQGIGVEDEQPQKSRRGRRHGKDAATPARSRKRRIIKWVAIVVLVVGLAIAGWIGFKALTASDNIFKGNIFGILQSQPLKQDDNGRTNILVLGTSEDDPGHQGGDLTDSMMVVSLDQHKKNVYMFSIPRDLWVDYGTACPSGYQGKINAYFACSDQGKSPEAEQSRMKDTQQLVGDIVGLNIQYTVHVNNTVIKDAVDAVGGVDVNIQGDGPVPYGVEPGSVLDRNFDWRCNYTCYLVKYSPGVHHLDGKHALFLSMARGDTAPTYGFARSNPDREANQQKIIIALKEKATSTGTLANIGKVTGLIDAMGDNLRTNFSTSEIRTLVNLAEDIPSKSIKSVPLDDGDNPVVKTGMISGQSVVVPTDGVFNYQGIQAFITRKLSSNPVVREGANVTVLNGSSTPGVAQEQADKLTAAGYTIDDIGNAPEGSYAPVEIYQLNSDMPATAAKLASRYHVKVKTTTPPVNVTADIDFVIIFGADPSAGAQ